MDGITISSIVCARFECIPAGSPAHRVGPTVIANLLVFACALPMVSNFDQAR